MEARYCSPYIFVALQKVQFLFKAFILFFLIGRKLLTLFWCVTICNYLPDNIVQVCTDTAYSIFMLLIQEYCLQSYQLHKTHCR